MPTREKPPRRQLRWPHLVLGTLAAGAVAIGAVVVASPSSSPTHTDSADFAVPLHTKGGEILDGAGRVVTLTGVNWFGFETGLLAPGGLSVRNYKSMLNQMAVTGFNTIRLPYSNDLFRPGNKPNGINYQLNPDLKGRSGLALMDKVVHAATSRGLKVILDQHRPNQNAQSSLPASGALSQQQWINDWVMLAKHYRHNALVIGADLHNEPNGSATWGTGNPQTDWRLMAQQAGNAVLKAAPNWLIFVEGVENYQGKYYWWGGNLQGAKRYPVQLSRPDHVVYEAHDYGPGVYNQSWFQAKNFPANLPAIWNRNWAYLKQQNIAPVLLGEFGGRSVGNDAEGKWQRALIAFLKKHRISYTYWSWNPDSSDTGGILDKNWQTVDKAKLDLLQTYQVPLPKAEPRR